MVKRSSVVARGSREGKSGAVALSVGSSAASTTLREARAAAQTFSAIEQRALDFIVSYLTKEENRHQILYCKEQLESGMCNTNAQTRDVQQKQVFHHTYTHWKSFPKYVIADVFVTICLYKKEFVDLIDAAGASQLRHAFCLVFGISEFAWWPPALHRHELLRQFLTKQLAVMGGRHKKLKNAVAADGTIDWIAAMGYEFTWSEPVENEDEMPTTGYLVKIAHDSGVSAQVRPGLIPTNFQIQEPWDDMRAEFVGDDAYKPKLHAFLPKTAEFRLLWSKAHFQTVATELDIAWKQRDALSQAADSSDILKTRSMRMKEAAKATAKARVPSHKIAVPVKITI